MLTEEVKKKMAKTKTKKPDAGELMEDTPVEETPVVEKRAKAAPIVITDEAFMQALEAVGGEAKITPLYEKFDKTNYVEITAPKLKTAIRKKGLDLAKAGKVQAVHPEGKRTFIFKTV